MEEYVSVPKKDLDALIESSEVMLDLYNEQRDEEYTSKVSAMVDRINAALPVEDPIDEMSEAVSVDVERAN